MSAWSSFQGLFPISSPGFLLVVKASLLMALLLLLLIVGKKCFALWVFVFVLFDYLSGLYFAITADFSFIIFLSLIQEN
jgi:hypothetical protein